MKLKFVIIVTDTNLPNGGVTLVYTDAGANACDVNLKNHKFDTIDEAIAKRDYMRNTFPGAKYSIATIID